MKEQPIQVLDASGVVTDLGPLIPTAPAAAGAERFPNGVPAGTPSPTISREETILEGQLAGPEQNLPGGHGRAGLAAASVQSGLDEFGAGLDILFQIR